MADPSHFAPDNQAGHYPQQDDTSSYYPDDQRDYHQSGYERREYISGQTEDISARSHYTSEGSQYGAGPVHGSRDNYNQHNYQQQQYSDHANDGYPSPGYPSSGYGPPPDAYPYPTSPAYSSEHDYSGYYPPPPGGQPDVYYKSDSYDPHTNIDNYQKPHFDVYNDFNNMSPPPPHDHEPSDAHTIPTYASSTQQFGTKENAELSDPMRTSIAAAPLPVKKRRRRCCRCCRCCSWKVCVITTFIILIILAVVGFFVFPRVPEVSIVGTDRTGSGLLLSTTRVNITFALRARIDNEENWIPFHFNKIEVEIFNRVSDEPVGTGKLVDYKLKPRATSFVNLPLRVEYWGNDTDPILQDFVNACGEGVQKRTSLNLDTVLKLFIWGIDWAYKPTIRTGATNLQCPYTLPVDDDQPN